MPAPMALIEEGRVHRNRVVALRGEIDVGSTPALRDWLERASDNGASALTVDLTSVEFMAVSGLYVLCDEQARMAHNRQRLTIVCSSARVLQLFEVCRLLGVLCIVERREDVSDEAWGVEDEQRTERLEAWLDRYSSTPPHDGDGPPAAS